ncbi:MAG TPA: hypothetical protein VGM43_17105 [Bryobacteraceae bacterium]
MSNLQQEIGALSQAEKMDLLDVLWESIEAEFLCSLKNNARNWITGSLDIGKSVRCHSVGASSGGAV